MGRNDREEGKSMSVTVRGAVRGFHVNVKNVMGVTQAGMRASIEVPLT